MIDQATITSVLRTITADYRATVIAAEMVEAGLSEENILFKNLSGFKRSTSKDLEHFYWNYEDEQEEQLVLELNKESIYDMLPEVVTHLAPVKKSNEPARKQFLEQRQQEKEARKFFAPFENEFNHRVLRLNLLERELSLQSNVPQSRAFFEFFYNDSSFLTDAQMLTLLYILPLAHKIRCDLKLAAFTVSKILNLPVEGIKHIRPRRRTTGREPATLLGEGYLGQDSILAGPGRVPVVEYEIVIKNVSPENFLHFSAGGSQKKILDFIEPYLFPAHIEVTFSTEVTASEKNNFIAGQENFSFLGFNSYI